MKFNIPTALKNHSGIYFISCIKTGYIYVGACNGFQQRFYNHNYELNNRGRCAALKQHADIYGKENLLFNLLELCDFDAIIDREQYYITLLKPELNVYVTTAGNYTSLATKCRKVVQCDVNWQTVEVYKGASDVEKILGYESNNVRKACRTGKKYNGYRWKYI